MIQIRSLHGTVYAFEDACPVEHIKAFIAREWGCPLHHLHLASDDGPVSDFQCDPEKDYAVWAEEPITDRYEEFNLYYCECAIEVLDADNRLLPTEVHAVEFMFRKNDAEDTTHLRLLHDLDEDRWTRGEGQYCTTNRPSEIVSVYPPSSCMIRISAPIWHTSLEEALCVEMQGRVEEADQSALAKHMAKRWAGYDFYRSAMNWNICRLSTEMEFGRMEDDVFVLRVKGTPAALERDEQDE